MIAFRRPQFVVVSSFLVSYGLSSAAMLIPLYAKERLEASETLLGAYGLAFNSLYIILGLYAGRLLKRIGFRASIFLAGLMMILTSLWMLAVGNRYGVIGPCLAWGLSSGFFWPAIESASAEKQSAEQIKRALGWFSYSWVSGQFAGFFFSGWLYEIDAYAPFVVSAGLGVAIVWMASRPRLFEIAPWPAARPHKDEHVSIERRRLFVRLAFLANFGLWVGVACIRTLLPEYANNHQLTGLRYGVLLTATMAGFITANAGLTYWHGWHYRPGVLLGGQCLAAGALVFFSFVDSYLLLFAALLLYGAVLGLTYFSSIYYGMELGGSSEGHGGRHEAVIATACGLGPLAGGWIIAAASWDRAAFPAAAFFILCVCAFQASLSRKKA